MREDGRDMGLKPIWNIFKVFQKKNSNPSNG